MTQTGQFGKIVPMTTPTPPLFSPLIGQIDRTTEYRMRALATQSESLVRIYHKTLEN